MNVSSPAEVAGLHEGDEILKVNNTTVADVRVFICLSYVYVLFMYTTIPLLFFLSLFVLFEYVLTSHLIFFSLSLSCLMTKLSNFCGVFQKYNSLFNALDVFLTNFSNKRLSRGRKTQKVRPRAVCVFVLLSTLSFLFLFLFLF